MKLGAFSISLNVKDLEKSRKFYEILGFEKLGGDADEGYLILKNGDTLIGLFAGFIKKNTLTFNPGWDQCARDLDEFDDVRKIQAKIKKAGGEMARECDPYGEGPAYITLIDPDGNPVLIDQHR